ncbi:MAG TPA: hypothetical protein QF564_07625 [Pirellulaceae bacterium]|nr:hypothetical protein [Pirellulaceae bacterium]
MRQALTVLTTTLLCLQALAAESVRADPPGRDSVLADQLTVSPGERSSLTWQAEKRREGHEPYVFFKIAAQSDRAGGYCNRGVQLLINGKPIDATRLSNRPPTATMQNGHVLSVAQGDGCFLIPWAPDFTVTDKDPVYALTDGVKACEYELYIGGLLQEGDNTITFLNTQSSGLQYTLMLGEVAFRTRPDKPATQQFGPAPTGELPVIVPQREFPRTYRNLDEQGATISLVVNGYALKLQSEFSTPGGQWVTGDNRYFRHRREVVEHDEWIEVRDTFTNLTDENLPLMQRHRLPVGGDATGVWLAGAKMPTKSGRHSGGANPSAYAATNSGGLGLVALNDEFRVHANMVADGGSISLADPHFVLAPQATYTAELAVVPSADPDFYAFVNAARRLLKANFTLDVCFAFMFHEPPVYQWSDKTFTSFIENKSANFVVKSNYGVRTKQGHPARSTDWAAGPHTIYHDFHKRVRRWYPDRSVKTGIYYHSFLDTHEPNKHRFADDRALDAAGNHITYGQGRHSYMSLYIPTLRPGHWGHESAGVLDVMLDRIGVDGVFWDEFAWSTTPFVYSHLDGCSADIDPKTHRVRRLKGSVALLSRDFRAHQVKRIQQRGAVLITNGAPWTRTLADHKFPAFTETGSISHCRKMLLYSPIALGDHLTERSERDAYRIMLRALDYGCLYAWYGSNFSATHKTLTEHMYPFTPLELHTGYVIGKERILTSRSGLFGWDDASEFRAYVYDREGRATDRYPVRRVERDGKAYAEVRIPGGFSAAIVREAGRS